MLDYVVVVGRCFDLLKRLDNVDITGAQKRDERAGPANPANDRR